MKRKLLRMIGLAVLLVTLPLYAESHKVKKASVDDRAIPKGALQVKLKSVDDAKQYFTYSPTIAIPEAPQPQDGLYRIEVNEKGKVAAVTILKGISPNADKFVMKQLVAWYAKPG